MVVVALGAGFFAGNQIGQINGSKITTQHYEYNRLPAYSEKIAGLEKELKQNAMDYIACYWAYTCTEFEQVCEEENIDIELIRTAKDQCNNAERYMQISAVAQK